MAREFNRRDFIKFAGAGTAMSLAGCAGMSLI
jgi:hypothetical protein